MKVADFMRVNLSVGQEYSFSIPRSVAIMFGLFRTPRDQVKKRVGRDAYIALSSVETYSDLQLQYLRGNKKEYAVGVILSMWACNSASASHFILSDYDYRFIRNLGNNCANRLSPDVQVSVGQIIEELIDKGLISHKTKTRKKRSKSIPVPRR